MRLLRYLLSALSAPIRWIVAWIRRDRLVIYPGQIVQIIGLPGTGKTMTAHVMMMRSRRYYPGGIYATEDAGSRIAGKISKTDLATHRLARSLILLDESSLNGFDAREWSGNFRQAKNSTIDYKNVLRQLKLVRHYHNAYITTSQSAGDNDSKLRGMAVRTYVCHKHQIGPIRWISVYRAIQWYEWSDGQYLPHLDEPSLIERICDPYASYHYLLSKRVYTMYNSWATVPELDNLPLYNP